MSAPELDPKRQDNGAPWRPGDLFERRFGNVDFTRLQFFRSSEFDK